MQITSSEAKLHGIVTLFLFACAPTTTTSFLLRPNAPVVKTIVLSGFSESTEAPAVFSRDFITNNDLFESIHESSEDVERIISSLELIDVSPGSTLIEEGKSDDDSMYFLESGKLICSIQNIGRTVATYKTPGDCFGELAMVFSQPRAASIKAVEDSRVWKLNSEAFLDSVDALDTCRKLLKTKYQTSSPIAPIVKVDVMALFDIATALSRPKKERASFHSKLSSLAVFAFFMVYMPLWSFGSIDNFGYPMLVDVKLLPPSLLQAQFTATLLCVIGPLGMIRLPKRTPPARLIHFSHLSWTNISFWTIGCSNLTGLQSYLCPIDAWGWSKVFIIIPFVMSNIKILEKVNDALVGPSKGKETIPFETPWPIGLGKTTAFGFLQLLLGIFMLPMLNSYELFQEYSTTFFQSPDYAGFVINNMIFGQLFVGLGALVLTLTFERKMSTRKANIFTVLLGFVMLWDTISILVELAITYLGGDKTFEAVFNAYPGLQSEAEYFAELFFQNHVLEPFIGLYVMTLAFSLLQYVQRSSQLSISEEILESSSKKTKKNPGVSPLIVADITLMFVVVIGVLLVYLVN